MNLQLSPIKNLQATWHTLHDLDRALAVSKINKSGTSIRAISRELNCSASTLRRLLKTLKALPEDRLLARRNIISTNELVRRADAYVSLQQHRKTERSIEKREAEAQQGCRNITNWIRSEQLNISAGIAVVTEARLRLSIAEQNNQLPREVAPPGMSTTAIIQNCRPTKPMSDDYFHAAWTSDWLIRWVYISMPDSWVRYQALELALETQHRRLI